MTAPMRCRRRWAVMRFVDQIGRRTAMTLSVVMASTRLPPSFGIA